MPAPRMPADALADDAVADDRVRQQRAQRDEAHPNAARPDHAHPDQAGPDEAHPNETRPDQGHPDQAGPDEAHRDRPQHIELTDAAFSLSGDAESGEPASAARRPPKRVRTIALTAVLVVGVAGMVAAGVTGWRVVSQKDATLTAPPLVAGLRPDDSDDGRSTADFLQTALAAEVDLDHTVAAAYYDHGGRGILFVGGTGLIWQPGDALEAAFGMVSDDQGSVTHVHDVAAGPLGGTAKCGRTATDDGDMAVCGWADHGSVALALFPRRSEDESADLVLAIRETAEKRH
ncbi:hypothetical protein [Krasilnikovia sp. MM14-A1004]|uniref:hypothetical protein n=1 Tax=Krasilnikovia sp. MM14-A1004 TaxID=3373541 RepID=UPI00399CCFF9